MLRFVSYLLNREKQYEPCKACEMAKYQLELVNREKKELLDVILDLVRPKPVSVPQATVQVNNPVPRVGTWSRRRAALEESDRIRASTMRGNQFVSNRAVMPATHEEPVKDLEDEIAKVERELSQGGDEHAG